MVPTRGSNSLGCLSAGINASALPGVTGQNTGWYVCLLFCFPALFCPIFSDLCFFSENGYTKMGGGPNIYAICCAPREFPGTSQVSFIFLDELDVESNPDLRWSCQRSGLGNGLFPYMYALFSSSFLRPTSLIDLPTQSSTVCLALVRESQSVLLVPLLSIPVWSVTLKVTRPPVILVSIFSEVNARSRLPLLNIFFKVEALGKLSRYPTSPDIGEAYHFFLILSVIKRATWLVFLQNVYSFTTN